MILFRELIKITKQVRGSENMFGYRTTLANQLYLWYAMLGKIYTTDKLSWQIKFVYFIPNFAQLCIGSSICAMYSIYGVRNDFILFTQITFLMMLMIYLSFIVPLISWRYGDRIEIMISLVDRMLVERQLSQGASPKQEGIINIMSSMVGNFLIFCIPLVVYVSVGTFDVVLFDDDEKVKNYIYYTTPFPNIHEYGSMRFLLFVNVGIASIAGSVAFVELWSIIAISFVWAAICHNEVVYICHDLRVDCATKSIKLATVQAAKAYQKVSSVIKSFRGFYNVLCTVTLIQLLVVAIANAYVVLLWDIQYLIKIRGSSAVFVCTLMILQLCSVGEMINHLTDLMAREIYSSPWHWSTKNRRDVQIFLCQAQAPFDLSAFKVYVFGLNTVLRFVNAVYTSANFLRKVTQK